MTARVRESSLSNQPLRFSFQSVQSTQRRRDMSHHKTYSFGNVPFSWENQPGVSKVTPSTEERPKAGPPQVPLKLPPPPFSADSPKLAAHGLYVPLPPCPFQPTRGISSKKGMSGREDDPFLAAYMECTKSVNKQKKASTKGKAGLEKVRLGFSCKHTCGVRGDGMVKLSQLPGFHLKGERLGRGDGRMGISSLKGRDY